MVLWRKVTNIDQDDLKWGSLCTPAGLTRYRQPRVWRRTRWWGLITSLESGFDSGQNKFDVGGRISYETVPQIRQRLAERSRIHLLIMVRVINLSFDYVPTPLIITTSDQRKSYPVPIAGVVESKGWISKTKNMGWTYTVKRLNNRWDISKAPFAINSHLVQLYFYTTFC